MAQNARVVGHTHRWWVTGYADPGALRVRRMIGRGGKVSEYHAGMRSEFYITAKCKRM